MTWFSDLGFQKYPLDPRSNPDLIGVSDAEERLANYIAQGNMCLLCGFTGSGKTSMLKRIQQLPELQKYRFVFISADGVKKNYLIEDAIKDKRSFVERFTFQKPRNLIILLDESHLANRILTESLKSKWNFTYPNGEQMIHSVVVSQIEPRLGTNFSGSFIDRLGRRVVQMRRLKVEELKEVLATRLTHNDKNLVNKFEDEGLTFLIKSADGSVRQLLEYTNAVLEGLHKMDPEKLKDEEFKIDRNLVFNVLQQADLPMYEKSMAASKGVFDKLLDNKKMRPAIEMFEQFDAMSGVTLAEKLDQTKKEADYIIIELEKKEAILYSHTDEGEKFYVLTPRLKYMLTKQ
jgi:energy-coupling factor transporter ATP-binding protein EcfA2